MLLGAPNKNSAHLKIPHYSPGIITHYLRNVHLLAFHPLGCGRKACPLYTYLIEPYRSCGIQVNPCKPWWIRISEYSDFIYLALGLSEIRGTRYSLHVTPAASNCES